MGHLNLSLQCNLALIFLCDPWNKFHHFFYYTVFDRMALMLPSVWLNLKQALSCLEAPDQPFRAFTVGNNSTCFLCLSLWYKCSPSLLPVLQGRKVFLKDRNHTYPWKAIIKKDSTSISQSLCEDRSLSLIRFSPSSKNRGPNFTD